MLYAIKGNREVAINETDQEYYVNAGYSIYKEEKKGLKLIDGPKSLEGELEDLKVENEELKAELEALKAEQEKAAGK